MSDKKYVIVKDGVVIGTAVAADDPNITIGGPPDSTVIEVPLDSPITLGWHAVFDDESQKWEFTAP